METGAASPQFKEPAKTWQPAIPTVGWDYRIPPATDPGLGELAEHM